MSRILCIDDEPAILRLLQVVLKQDGHEAVLADSARAGLAALGNGTIDAVLLDLGLPDRDGLELLSAIRARSAVPVIIVSARGETVEKVTALDLGAADFVTKPFDGDELRARLRAASRQSGKPEAAVEQLAFGPVFMDLARHEVRVRGDVIGLTPKEFALLQALTEAGGRVLTHRALLERVWGKAHGADVEYLRVAVRALRLKIETDPARPALLINEPGIGYRLIGD